MKRSLPSVVLPIVALLCVGLFLQGCYLCPWGQDPFEFVQYSSFKLNQALLKETWVSIGTHRFDQPVQFEGGRLQIDAVNHGQQMRPLKTSLRFSQFRNEELIERWSGAINFKANGNQKKPIMRNLGPFHFQAGDLLAVEAKANRKVAEGTQFAYNIAVKF